MLGGVRGEREFALKRISEEELAATVVVWFNGGGWDVYQEVRPGRWDGIADIVAIKNEVVCVVECKASLGLSVIEQALRWKGSAALIMVAVPKPKSLQARRAWLGRTILREKGIGLFYVQARFDELLYLRAEPEILPEWNCSLDKRWKNNSPWLSIVSEDHKDHAKAGSARGGHFTPFKKTMGLMAGFVRDRPGCTRKEIANGIDHHYPSDTGFESAMTTIFMRGWCPGVDQRMEDGRCRYYPKER